MAGAQRMDVLQRLVRQIRAYATLERVTWLVEDRLAACRYPRTETALRELAEQGVDLLVNLHERPHSAAALARHALTELHVPVRDFAAPTLQQLEQGIAAIEQALADRQTVAVHCGAGLGRTGTLLACYLVKQGLGPDEALARVRAVRPGSVETRQQELAIEQYARPISRALAGLTPPARLTTTEPPDGLRRCEGSGLAGHVQD